MNYDDGSEKSVEVSTAVESNVPSEYEDDDDVVERNAIKNQECDGFVLRGNENILEQERKEAVVSEEAGIGQLTNHEVKFDKAGSKLTDKMK